MDRTLERGALWLLVAVAAGSGVIGCGGDERVADGAHFQGVELIDNMEDGQQYILSDDGRVGLWYTYNDASPSGTQEPALGFPMYRTRKPNGQADPSSQVPARECGGGPQNLFASETECSFVARTWGTGQRSWGAGMGVDLNGEGGIKNPFDASKYGGIGFFAIGSIRPNTPQQGVLRVNAQDVRTTPESADAADRRGIGRCDAYLPDGSKTGRCNDHYGYPVSGIVTNEWRWFTVPFHCMTSGNWGYPSAPGSGGQPSENVLRRDAVVGIQFQVPGADPTDTGATGGAVLPFDLSIDNLAFLDESLVNDSTPCMAPPAN
ncbi:MAG: hypothetical protein ABI895_04670 [Deltaproteobacteria bacterium]